MVLYTLNNSSCRKAARERIPRSVHKYVTGVSERSQRICNLKYDGYKLVINLRRPAGITTVIAIRGIALHRRGHGFGRWSFRFISRRKIKRAFQAAASKAKQRE